MAPTPKKSTAAKVAAKKAPARKAAKKAPARRAAAKKSAAKKAAPAAAEKRQAKGFAGKAGDVAADVRKLVDDTRDRLDKVTEAHAELHSTAEPADGQQSLWAAFRRVSATFEDLARILEQTDATAVDLERAVAADDA